MSCCGRQRAALSRSVTNKPGAVLASAPVRYLGDNDIQVRGPSSGRLYHFSPENPQQAVVPQDATVLLRSRLFRRG